MYIPCVYTFYKINVYYLYIYYIYSYILVTSGTYLYTYHIITRALISGRLGACYLISTHIVSYKQPFFPHCLIIISYLILQLLQIYIYIYISTLFLIATPSYTTITPQSPPLQAFRMYHRDIIKQLYIYIHFSSFLLI